MRNKITTSWGQPATLEWICGPLLCLAIGLSASLNTAAGEPTQRYAIAAQSLNNALMEFATQSRVKLIFDADLLRGQSSSGLTGEHTLEQGLARLLEGTGLRHRLVDAGTVTLDRVDPLAALVAEAMKPRHYAGAAQPAPKKPEAPPKKPQEGQRCCRR